MAFPVFAKSMQKCDAILRPRGMNIYDIFDNKNVTKWSNILCSYVGTVAVQVLHLYNLPPNYFTAMNIIGSR